MRSLLGRPADPESVPPAPMPDSPGVPSGWDGLKGRTKLALLGGAAICMVGFVMYPTTKKQAVADGKPQEHPPSRISDYEAPSVPNPFQNVSSNTGDMVDGHDAPRKRRRPVASEMALYQAPVVVPAVGAPAGVVATGAVPGEPGGASAWCTGAS